MCVPDVTQAARISGVVLAVAVTMTRVVAHGVLERWRDARGDDRRQLLASAWAVRACGSTR